MSGQNKDRIIQRIKKCLALSESDNEHEAANALRQAQRMMEKHGIDMEEAKRPEFTVRDLSTGKRARGGLREAEVMLYAVVCEFFGCSVYLSDNWPVIVGEAPAPEIAEYAAATLLRQLRQNREASLEKLEASLGGRLNRSARREFNSSYSATWVYAVSKKVEAFAQQFTEQTRSQHQAAVKKHWGIDKDVPDKAYRENRHDSAISQYAIHKGAQDGKRAQLNHGVNEGPGQARISVQSVQGKEV